MYRYFCIADREEDRCFLVPIRVILLCRVVSVIIKRTLKKQQLKLLRFKTLVWYTENTKRSNFLLKFKTKLCPFRTLHMYIRCFVLIYFIHSLMKHVPESRQSISLQFDWQTYIQRGYRHIIDKCGKFCCKQRTLSGHRQPPRQSL